MAIPFKCTSCGRGLQAKPEMAGKKTKCPGCGTILTIPSAAPAATAPGATAPAAKAPAATPAGKPPAVKTAPAIDMSKAPAPTGEAAVVTCQCGAKIRTKPEWAGKTIKCPKCENRIKVPAAAPAAPVAAARPVPRPAPAPAPIDEDDPFAGGIPGPSDEGFGGDGAFNDEGDEGTYEEPPARPARRASGPPPEKQGGGFLKILLVLFLLILLAAGAFVAYGYFFMNLTPMQLVDNLLGTAKPKTPAIIPSGKKMPVDNDDNDKKEPTDPEAKDPKDPKEVKLPDATEPEPKETKLPDAKEPESKAPKDPVPPVEPEAKERAAPKQPADAKLLGFVGGDFAGFFSVNPEAIVKTPRIQRILKDLEGTEDGKQKQVFVDLIGVDVGDINSIVGAYRDVPMPKGQAVPGVYFIATAKPTRLAGFEELAKNGTLTKKKGPSDQPYYALKLPKQTLAIVGAGTKQTLIGDETEVLAYTATGKLNPGGLSEALTVAMENSHLAAMGFQLPKDLAKGLLADAPKEAKEMFGPLAELKSGHVLVVAGPTVKVNATLVFEDAVKAAEAKKTLDGLLDLGKTMLPMATKGVPPEIAKHAEPALNSVKPTLDGAKIDVPIEINLSLDDLTALMIREKLVSDAGAARNGNNLRQLALAMHTYHDANQKFPDAKVGGGLSWRVAVLPYLEQNPLYARFKQDEPWDSDTNKALIESMPEFLKHPNRPAPPGQTYYRIIVGPQTIFPDMKGLSLRKITDGAHNTILIVEARDPVIWTKPDEVVYDPKGPLPALGDAAGNIPCAMADGSSLVLTKQPEAFVRGMITATGGENLDELAPKASPRPATPTKKSEE